MATPKIRPLLYGMLGAFGVGLSFIALLMLSQVAQNSENFDRLANSILWVNVLCLFVLMVLLIGNLSKLYRDYRSNVPGSKLKARMVGMFVGLAIIPLLIVFYFSMQFINRGIDTWFNVEVEAGLDDALTLSRNALAMQMRDHLAATEQIKAEANARFRESGWKLEKALDLAAGDWTHEKVVAALAERAECRTKSGAHEQLIKDALVARKHPDDWPDPVSWACPLADEYKPAQDGTDTVEGIAADNATRIKVQFDVDDPGSGL